MPYRTIAKHASRGVLQRYREADEEFSAPAEERIYCSVPDCGGWVRTVDRASQTAVCRRGHAMCVLCRQHPPHAQTDDCPQDTSRQLVERLAAEEGWRRCLDCGILVEHLQDCQHMTCRCGAQFCYVCGARWRTCACTVHDLDDLKRRARGQRGTRPHSGLDEWLHDTLRVLERYEQEEEERTAAAAMQEERRKKARERARREEARLVELERRYQRLGEVLEQVEDTQRTVLANMHERERKRSEECSAKERDSLASGQERALARLRSSTAERIGRMGRELEREYHTRLVWEKHLEADYQKVLAAFWGKKTGVKQYFGQAMRAYMKKNDERWHRWCTWRDSELKRARYAAEEELATQGKLMEIMRQQQNEVLAARERVLRSKHVAEERWLELVVAERRRLLAEMEMVERENGGEGDEENVLGPSDDETF